MAAKSTSTTSHSDNSFSQRARTAGLVAKSLVRLVIGRFVPWCRDHSLSMALLLIFPAVIAGYYWKTSKPAEQMLPNYLSAESASKPRANRNRLPKIEDAPVVSVIPETPPKAQPPQMLDFSTDTPGAGYPQPLPIAVGSSPSRSFPESGPELSWSVNAIQTPPATSISRNCIWLTGTIETIEEAAPAIQSASRVHELTFPPLQ